MQTARDADNDSRLAIQLIPVGRARITRPACVEDFQPRNMHPFG